MSELSPNETQLHLFESGPFPHIQKPLQLLRPTGLATQFKVAIVLLLGWVPLVLLVVLQGLTQHNHPLASFFNDFGVHARSLLAAPLFFVAEAICLPRLGTIVRHFVAADLITTGDRARFDAAVAATGRHLNSTLAEVLAVLLTYSLIALLMHFLPPSVFPLWYSPSQQGYPHLSWAGWWYAVVSLPLLLIILLGWVWRILLWSWFLFRVSRLRLHLIPAHPDLAGGLKFLDLSLVAFMPVGFTVGIIAAGSVANKVVLGHVSVMAFQKPVLALLVVIVIFLWDRCWCLSPVCANTSGAEFFNTEFWSTAWANSLRKSGAAARRLARTRWARRIFLRPLIFTRSPRTSTRCVVFRLDSKA